MPLRRLKMTESLLKLSFAGRGKISFGGDRQGKTPCREFMKSIVQKGGKKCCFRVVTQKKRISKFYNNPQTQRFWFVLLFSHTPPLLVRRHFHFQISRSIRYIEHFSSQDLLILNSREVAVWCTKKETLTFAKKSYLSFL